MIITKSAELRGIRRLLHRSKTPSPGRENPIHRFHETLGNRGVQRLYESGQLQAKLGIGPPGDRFEQEADRVADQVMRHAGTAGAGETGLTLGRFPVRGGRTG